MRNQPSELAEKALSREISRRKSPTVLSGSERLRLLSNLAALFFSFFCVGVFRNTQRVVLWPDSDR